MDDMVQGHDGRLTIETAAPIWPDQLTNEPSLTQLTVIHLTKGPFGKGPWHATQGCGISVTS